MAVGANHVAFLDLVKNALPVATCEPLADSELLVAQVVELKNEWIGFATVDAGVKAEVLTRYRMRSSTRARFRRASAAMYFSRLAR